MIAQESSRGVMVNNLSCPRCVKVLRFRKDQIGKRVRCPLCTARFRLKRRRPASQAAPPRASQPAARPTPAPAARAPRKKSFSALSLLLVLTPLLLAGAGLAGYLLFQWQ